MNKLGDQLAALRKQHKLTQADIAERLNVSQQVVSNIERNISEPDISMLKGLADIYSLSLDDLVGRDFSDNADSIENQIMGCIKRLDAEGKELSLGLINQVAKRQDSKDGN